MISQPFPFKRPDDERCDGGDDWDVDVDVEVVFLRERLDFRAVRFVGVGGGIFRLTYPSKPPSHAQRGDIKTR